MVGLPSSHLCMDSERRCVCGCGSQHAASALTAATDWTTEKYFKQVKIFGVLVYHVVVLC